jgi:hypothetical protein
MSQTTVPARAGITTRLTSWISRIPQTLSTRIHASADQRARACGWQVTKTTGPLGLGGRTYRDPRFDHRRRQLAPEAPSSRIPQPNLRRRSP